MSIGERPLDPSTVEGVNIEEGCNVPRSCETAKCPIHSVCVDLWDANDCQCKKGKFYLLITSYREYCISIECSLFYH